MPGNLVAAKKTLKTFGRVQPRIIDDAPEQEEQKRPMTMIREDLKELEDEEVHSKVDELDEFREEDCSDDDEQRRRRRRKGQA